MTPAQRTLAIECTTEACSVALFEGTALLAGDYRLLGRGHAEALVPMIEALPDKGGAQAITVGLGPGSFTGVRIGLAAARALALAWGARLSGYPTLALVAAMARARVGERPVLVATTGGHGEWFVEPFDAAGNSIHALASLRPAEVAALTASLASSVLAGSQAEALAALVEDSAQALPLWPDAREVMALPDHAWRTDLSPLYGRAPDARLPGGRLPEEGHGAKS